MIILKDIPCRTSVEADDFLARRGILHNRTISGLDMVNGRSETSEIVEHVQHGLLIDTCAFKTCLLPMGQSVSSGLEPRQGQPGGRNTTFWHLFSVLSPRQDDGFTRASVSRLFLLYSGIANKWTIHEYVVHGFQGSQCLMLKVIRSQDVHHVPT